MSAFRIIRQLFVVVSLGCVILLLARVPILAQDRHPLSMDELLKICSSDQFKGHSDLIITNFIQKNGIAFLPSPENLNALQKEKIDSTIIDEIKKPPTYSQFILVRVCHFTTPTDNPDDTDLEKKFIRQLSEKLHDATFTSQIVFNWPLLQGISIGATIGPTTCFDESDVNFKRATNRSYVTFSGRMYRESSQPFMDIVLTYFPIAGNPFQITNPIHHVKPLETSTDCLIHNALNAAEDMILGSRRPAPVCD